MKPSETQQLKLNQLEAEMMTIDMNLASINMNMASFKSEKEILESRIKTTRDSIIHERKCEEKEMDPAVEYVRTIKPHGSKQHTFFTHSQLGRAHEAGQKHGAGVERGKSDWLRQKVKQFCKDFQFHMLTQEGVENWKRYFAEELENPEGRPAEPARAKFPCFSCGHPLTPIKD